MRWTAKRSHGKKSKGRIQNIKVFFYLCSPARFGGTVQPEWRNGRRDGLKIHCPLKAWGFESPLGHGQGTTVRTLSEFRSCSDGSPFAYALLALRALRGTPIRYSTPKPPPSGRWLSRRKRLRNPAIFVSGTILTGFGGFPVNLPDFSLILTVFASNPVRNSSRSASAVINRTSPIAI